MRYLVISDIHSNWEALEAVLAAASGKFDEILCCGDIVGYGPNPREIIDKLQHCGARLVRGNHDKAVCGLDDAADFNDTAREAILWTRKILSPDQHQYLLNLPHGPLPVEGGAFQLVHGAVHDEDEYLYDPAEAFDDLHVARLPLTFFGHTHYQCVFSLSPQGEFVSTFHEPGAPHPVIEMELEKGWIYLVNPGSVGQPRDDDPRAAFGLYDSGTRRLELRRVKYDIESVQKKMREFRLPDYLIKRLSFGR
ncbi:MAG: metallophosphoesterase family protein [Acidobacteriia bacterium]|nr:metallophosphoesterase family protein [Terriglobia bacterium]